MSYYRILGLDQEPFSTSPNINFFYRSVAHHQALQRLEIAVRLKRGLSVILGDVGVGKTTLMRMLVNSFKNERDYLFHMMLDPSFKSEYQFMQALSKIFRTEPAFRSSIDYKEAIETFLFRRGVDEGKTIVLMIDEGQKISPHILEILRILLNYETNDYKLLQLVILGQMELLPRIRRIRNFTDRIAMKYIINPLNLEETKEMVEFRLSVAGMKPNLTCFTDEAIQRVYEYTQGYPRRITILCHNVLEELVMTGEEVADSKLIDRLFEREEMAYAI
jgi:general secretion pathway protein A